MQRLAVVWHNLITMSTLSLHFIRIVFVLHLTARGVQNGFFILIPSCSCVAVPAAVAAHIHPMAHASP